MNIPMVIAGFLIVLGLRLIFPFNTEAWGGACLVYMGATIFLMALKEEKYGFHYDNRLHSGRNNIFYGSNGGKIMKRAILSGLIFFCVLWGGTYALHVIPTWAEFSMVITMLILCMLSAGVFIVSLANDEKEK